MIYSGHTGETVEMPLNASAYEEHLQKLIAESTFKKKTVQPSGVSDISNSFR